MALFSPKVLVPSDVTCRAAVTDGWTYPDADSISMPEQPYVRHVLSVVRSWTPEERARNLDCKPGEARVFVFRFPPEVAWWPVLSVAALTPRVCSVIVDDYGSDMNAPGWSVRGGSVKTLLDSLFSATSSSYPYRLLDVALPGV